MLLPTKRKIIMGNEYKDLSNSIFLSIKNKLLKFNISEYCRFSIVYDFGSLEFFPLTMGGLSKAIENEYRLKISSPSDFQLLWNPAEFPIYATPDLQIDVPDEIKLFVQKGLENSNKNHEMSIRKSLSIACKNLNQFYNNNPFFFNTDPELLDLKENISLIENIPVEFSSELPKWL